MNKHQIKALFFLILLAGPLSSFAKFPGLLQRFQLGYSFLSNTAELSNTSFPETYEMKTNAAWGFTAGTFIPIKRMGGASSLNLGIDYMYNMMTWKSTLSTQFGDLLFDGATVQMALPIGLDFKFGADALQVKTYRFCGTLGAGAYPSYALSTVTGSPISIDPVFAFAPYVKAEVGIYAGICMKVRALYAIGDLEYMSAKETADNSSPTTKLTGKSNLAISLLIMPFSYKWQEEDWWNTY